MVVTWTRRMGFWSLVPPKSRRWGAPSLLAGARGAQAAVGRVEAVAGWAEVPRDTMAGAAGLEQTEVAIAPSPASRSGPRSPP